MANSTIDDFWSNLLTEKLKTAALIKWNRLIIPRVKGDKLFIVDATTGKLLHTEDILFIRQHVEIDITYVVNFVIQKLSESIEKNTKEASDERLEKLRRRRIELQNLAFVQSLNTARKAVTESDVARWVDEAEDIDEEEIDAETLFVTSFMGEESEAVKEFKKDLTQYEN